MSEILNERAYRRGRARLRTVTSQGRAAELAGRVAQYEALRRAGGLTLTLASLGELPRALVKARVARGWTQERLARELGLPKQQIQRYEATGYASASLRRVLEVAEALGIRFSATLEAGPGSGPGGELARLLAGYAAAEAVQAAERRVRLRRMTPRQSRRIFDDLCDTYYRLAPLHGPSSLDPAGRLDHRLEVRRALEALARKRGDLR